ncbi:unnamed protein product [Darwinula stevensoni]|uniref:F-box domain-containing protein n=1 Tax=Darwinula stevensoni TaxID=69355 RepID=A0A7R8ZXW8_9CRUS|nr:unnamed protein product [Darwinula stevensoni]CAG0879256.1 unnamed protein product [Darwinula stevensoni]
MKSQKRLHDHHSMAGLSLGHARRHAHRRILHRRLPPNAIHKHMRPKPRIRPQTVKLEKHDISTKVEEPVEELRNGSCIEEELENDAYDCDEDNDNDQSDNALEFPVPSVWRKDLKRPLYVVRPASLEDDENELVLNRTAMVCVFQYLKRPELAVCMQVCRDWNRWCLDPKLWYSMDLSQQKITQHTLQGIVRCQPTRLDLSWSFITGNQLRWLLPRLPQLKELQLVGLPWNTVKSIVTASCPVLSSLNVSYVGGLGDIQFAKMLSQPPDSRPGMVDFSTRLRHLVEIRLAGCDISDSSLEVLASNLSSLAKVDISCCTKIGDAGISRMVSGGLRDRLVYCDAQKCPRVTDKVLTALSSCPNLVHLDLRHCECVSSHSLKLFAADRDGVNVDGKLVTHAKHSHCQRIPSKIRK